jgi:hypothetical protein
MEYLCEKYLRDDKLAKKKRQIIEKPQFLTFEYPMEPHVVLHSGDILL